MKLKHILTIASLLVATLGEAQSVGPDTTGMNIDAHTWTRNVRLGWNLGNQLECGGTGLNWETSWGNPRVTIKTIKAVKAAGFNAIRIPVQWGQNVVNKETMEIGKKYLDRVQEVVDWCLAENMWVIINTHHEKWLEESPFYKDQKENNRKLAALWQQIATRFRDYDARLVFAGINETQVNWQAPTQENTDVTNSYNQTFVNTVRATGGKNTYRNLVVQTYSCNPHYGLKGFVIPTDPTPNRLSVEFHYYNPYVYCSGKLPKDGGFYFWGDAFKEYGKTPDENETSLIQLFDEMKAKWYDKGLGIVMGEYGVSSHYTDDANKIVEQANETYYLQKVTSEARKRGYAPFVWDNNKFGNGEEQFGIFDRNDRMKVKNTFFLQGLLEGAKDE
jgi:endoglucanase